MRRAANNVTFNIVQLFRLALGFTQAFAALWLEALDIPHSCWATGEGVGQFSLIGLGYGYGDAEVEMGEVQACRPGNDIGG